MGRYADANRSVAPWPIFNPISPKETVTMGLLDKVAKFQTAKRISYPPKFLEVKAPGTVAASAGKILTPEEAEKQRLEAYLAAARMSAAEQAAWARASQRIVRPGSPVYVQVVDPDQDMTAGIDTVNIAATTSTGDIVAAVALTETPAKVTVTCSPASAFPHIGFSLPRCRTMWLPNTEGRLTSANKAVGRKKLVSNHPPSAASGTCAMSGKQRRAKGFIQRETIGAHRLDEQG